MPSSQKPALRIISRTSAGADARSTVLPELSGTAEQVPAMQGVYLAPGTNQPYRLKSIPAHYPGPGIDLPMPAPLQRAALAFSSGFAKLVGNPREEFLSDLSLTEDGRFSLVFDTPNLDWLAAGSLLPLSGPELEQLDPVLAAPLRALVSRHLSDGFEQAGPGLAFVTKLRCASLAGHPHPSAEFMERIGLKDLPWLQFDTVHRMIGGYEMALEDPSETAAKDRGLISKSLAASGHRPIVDATVKMAHLEQDLRKTRKGAATRRKERRDSGKPDVTFNPSIREPIFEEFSNHKEIISRILPMAFPNLQNIYLEEFIKKSILLFLTVDSKMNGYNKRGSASPAKIGEGKSYRTENSDHNISGYMHMRSFMSSGGGYFSYTLDPSPVTGEGGSNNFFNGDIVGAPPDAFFMILRLSANYRDSKYAVLEDTAKKRIEDWVDNVRVQIPVMALPTYYTDEYFYMPLDKGVGLVTPSSNP